MTAANIIIGLEDLKLLQEIFNDLSSEQGFERTDASLEALARHIICAFNAVFKTSRR